MLTSTSLPIGVSATIRGRPRIRSIFLWSNSRITSPGSILASSAGPSGVTLATSAPAASSQTQALGDLVGDRLDADTQPAALDPPLLLQRLDHRHREIGGDREADPDVAAAGREDRRVDTDHLAVEIEARAAGIAAIDRRVDLQEVVVGSGPNVTRAGRDDARGDRAAEPERIADGDDPVADPDRVAVGKRHRGQGVVDLDLEQREIGLRCRAPPAWRRSSYRR